MELSRGKHILIHVAGVLAFLAIPIVFSPDFGMGMRMFEVAPLRRDIISYALLILIFYFQFYYAIPKYFHARKYFVFAIIALVCWAIASFLPELFNHGMRPHDPLPRPDIMPGKVHHGPPLIHIFERTFFRFAIVLTTALLISIVTRLKEVERARTEAELSYLKAQINPHFLFNTLNSIYSLAIIRSEKTPTAVQKLSDMMRYVTTEAHNDSVPLAKEIAYIVNYVDLQRIRLGETVRIEFSVEGEPGSKKIAPLVLIPFVENAFKYGVNPEEDSYVQIRIAISGSKLTMTVQNKIVHVDYLDEYKSGHGMSNASQRLSSSYGGRHKLDARHENDEFRVYLEIEL
jgi:hypothetical protein